MPWHALSLGEESLACFRALGNTSGMNDSLDLLAHVLFVSQGDPTTVRSLFEESLALHRKSGDKLAIAELLVGLGRLVLMEGDAARAHTLAEESLLICKHVGSPWGIASSLSLLGSVTAARSDYATARALYEESLAIARQLDDKLMITSCLAGLAGVVSAQGEGLWAVQLWGASESLREAINVPLAPVSRADYEREVASARLQLGERAFVAAWALGRTMTPEQALAARERTQTPSSIPGGPPTPLRAQTAASYPGGLTAREVEVLRLVAQGLSDAQVAEQLVISRRTVNWHLSSIYSKLQVSSRSAATRFAVEHRLV